MKVLLLLFQLLATILGAPLWVDPLNIGAQIGLWDTALWKEATEEAVIVETAVAGVIAEGIVQAGGLDKPIFVKLNKKENKY